MIDPIATIDAVDRYDSNLENLKFELEALKTLRHEIATNSEEGERKWWESRRAFYEERLCRTAAQIADAVGVLLLVAKALPIEARGLVELAAWLAFRRGGHIPDEMPDPSLLARAEVDRTMVESAATLETCGVTNTGGESELSERQEHALQAMLEMRAVSKDTRQPQHAILARALAAEDYNSHKDVLQELRLAGFVAAWKGRSGGFWLTERGIAAANALTGA